MNLEQLGRSLPLLLKANIVPLIIGHKGTGKTSVSYQVGKKLGFDRVYNMRLGQMSDAGDITGLPDFVKFELVTGETETRTSFMAPNFFPKKGEKVLIVLDEINRVQNRQILNAVFQMIERDRKVGEYQFPEETRIIALANPPTDEYSGAMDFRDEAFKSRFCHISYMPTNNEYLNFISGPGNFNSSVVTFLTNPENHDFIHGKKSHYSIDYMNPDFRSWEFVSDFMAQKPDEDLIIEIVQGMVGTAAAAKFLEHLSNTKQKNPIPLNDILTNKNIKFEVEDRLSQPELLDVTFNNLTQEVKRRSENKQLFTESEVIGIRDLLLSANKELSLQFLMNTITEQSLILSSDYTRPLIFENHEITCLVFKAAGIIEEGQEYKLIGLHENVEIIDETEKKEA